MNKRERSDADTRPGSLALAVRQLGIIGISHQQQESRTAAENTFYQAG